MVGPTIDKVIARARELLLAHISQLVKAGQAIGIPKAADTVERQASSLLAAVDVPDDVGITRVELKIPALALARIDSIARRHGLTRAALFVFLSRPPTVGRRASPDGRSAGPRRVRHCSISQTRSM